MSELDNQFREISKDITKLIKNNKELSSDNTDIDIKRIIAEDKAVYKKITKLAKQDFSILTKGDMHKAKLQALQSQLMQSKGSSALNAMGYHKKTRLKQSR